MQYIAYEGETRSLMHAAKDDLTQAMLFSACGGSLWTHSADNCGTTFYTAGYQHRKQQWTSYTFDCKWQGVVRRVNGFAAGIFFTRISLALVTLGLHREIMLNWQDDASDYVALQQLLANCIAISSHDYGCPKVDHKEGTTHHYIHTFDNIIEFTVRKYGVHVAWIRRCDNVLQRVHLYNVRDVNISGLFVQRISLANT